MTSTEARTDATHDMERSGVRARPLLTGRRLRSLDVARGLVVSTSVMVTNLPGITDPVWLAHADWYGFTLHDVYLPMFLFLFGAGMAIAYRRGVDVRRVARRTATLALYGVIFNGIVGWDFTLGSLRLTSVLLVFSVTGLVVTVVTRILGRWWQVLLLAAAVLFAHQLALGATAGACGLELPSEACNPSAVVDPLVFGADHTYRGGTAGYDPEGLGMYPGALATVLIGYAAGKLLWRDRVRGAGRVLLGLAGGLAVLTPLLAQLVPVAKKLWTPSFVTLTAALAALLLAVLHALLDRRDLPRPVDRGVVLVEAYGRNSLLVYFGKFIFTAVVVNVHLPGTGTSLRAAALDALGAPSPVASWVYMLLLVSAWSVLVWQLHRRGRYFTA